MKQGFSMGGRRSVSQPQELQVVGDWAFDRFDWTMETIPGSGGPTTAIMGSACGFGIGKSTVHGRWPRNLE